MGLYRQIRAHQLAKAHLPLRLPVFVEGDGARLK